MKILLASNNEGKSERFARLLASVSPRVTLMTPTTLGLLESEVEENASTLMGNAELKARAYAGLTKLPVLANDTGFFVTGDGFVSAPKRYALGDAKEQELTPGELSRRLLEFWKGIATKHGGTVDAAWVEAFVVLYPDGTLRQAESRREVILTNHEFGIPHPQMPVRALYLSKETNKPAVEHTAAEELAEMAPIIAALRQVLG